MTRDASAPFEQLDFLYMPTRDTASDMAYMVDVLGGRVVFAVEGMGSRVAGIAITGGPPLLLLADHVEGDAPVLVYRVSDLQAALSSMEARGWSPVATFEIPHGPCCSFETPGGQRVALYELTRPEAAHHFDGRRDF